MRICPTCEETYPDDVEECPTDGAPTVPIPERLGERLPGMVLDDRWEVEELLGEGGMGAVFTGRQTRLDRAVAIKVLHPDIAQREAIVARFMREAKILSAFRHPNIVTIFDFGRDDQTGLLYLVMELLDGVPLSQWLIKEDVTISDVLQIMEQVTRALVQAHDEGIVHRDLKPQNIFVSPVAGGVHVKVLDFGIAKVTDDHAAPLTRTGEIQGTPHYMAPEQARGKQTGPRTDLYAVGAVLWEMLSGRPPFVGDTPMAVLLKHCSEELPALKESWGLDEPPHEGLIDVTNRLLEKAPSDRQRDALALLEELQALRKEKGAPAPDGQMAVEESRTLDMPPPAGLEPSDAHDSTLHEEFPDPPHAATPGPQSGRVPSVARRPGPDTAEEIAAAGQAVSDEGRDEAVASEGTSNETATPATAGEHAEGALPEPTKGTSTRTLYAIAVVALGLAIGSAIVVSSMVSEGEPASSPAPPAAQPTKVSESTSPAQTERPDPPSTDTLDPEVLAAGSNALSVALTEAVEAASDEAAKRISMPPEQSGKQREPELEADEVAAKEPSSETSGEDGETIEKADDELDSALDRQLQKMRQP